MSQYLLNERRYVVDGGRYVMSDDGNCPDCDCGAEPPYDPCTFQNCPDVCASPMMAILSSFDVRFRTSSIDSIYDFTVTDPGFRAATIMFSEATEEFVNNCLDDTESFVDWINRTNVPIQDFVGRCGGIWFSDDVFCYSDTANASTPGTTPGTTIYYWAARWFGRFDDFPIFGSPYNPNSMRLSLLCPPDAGVSVPTWNMRVQMNIGTVSSIINECPVTRFCSLNIASSGGLAVPTIIFTFRAAADSCPTEAFWQLFQTQVVFTGISTNIVEVVRPPTLIVN